MRRRKRNPPVQLSTESAAAMVLSLAFKMAEGHSLCPLCVMECAIEMMDKAESEGVIRHLSDEAGVPTGETAH